MLSSVDAKKAQAVTSAPLIFVIEDDADIREVLSALLSDEGYTVRSWASGVEALAAMDAGTRPDLIVLDLMMPQMDGWQFRVEQRKRPHIADVPVLVVSADGSAKAAAVDADAFMKKPLDVMRMTAVIDRLLTAAERRRLGTQSRETERLRSLGTLVAGVAHEINNPLTFVSGSLELATRSLRQLVNGGASVLTAPDAARRIEQALADARVGTERIASIVGALSHFARVEGEHSDAVDLHRVLDGAATLAAGALRGRARLVKQYGSVPIIVGSEARLGQVFLNLLVNAAQAIPNDGREVGVVRVVTGTTDEGAFVDVIDSGVGIPEELTARVFEPFFTTKPAGEGTGLGLSISHDIVATHGGSLSVSSKVGHGTTFRVLLPARAAATRARASEPPSATKSGERERPRETAQARVLVVDDEAMVCKLIGRVLAAHDVSTFTSARDALAAITTEDRDYDIVFCDLSMPGMDGPTFYAEVSRASAALASRFVFMTGASSTEYSRRFLGTVAAPVLDKPFSIERVTALVTEARKARDARERGPAQKLRAV